MNFFIKKAESKDFPTLQKLAEEILFDHYVPIFGEAKTDYLLDQFYRVPALEKQAAEGQLFRVVLDETGEAFGFYGYANQGDHRFFLNKFYLKKVNQGHGLGSLVLRKMLEEIGPELHELRLNVNRLNFKSINFYFKNGFTIESWRDIPIGNGFEMNTFQMLLVKLNDEL